MIIIGQILKGRYSMTVQGISNERVPAFGYYNLDCMEGMKHFPDNYFDLAIVDPPYFSGPERRGHYGHSESPIGVNRLYEKMNKWQVPGEEYFIELLRVSKEQIIWGCNYYDYNFGPGRIVWDKCNGSCNFSDCEIAYCSMQTTVRLFRYMWNGMFQGRSMSEGFSREIKLETKSGFIRRRNRLFYMNGCCRNMQNQVLKFWIRMSGVRVV